MPTEIRSRLILYRYEAACAEVRSAAGQGSEEARRGEPERAGKRRRALDWLRADLDLTARLATTAKCCGGRPPVGYPILRWPASATRRHWRSCPKPSAMRGGACGRTWRRISPLTRWSKGGTPPPDDSGIARSTAMRENLLRGPTESGDFWFEYAALSLLSGDRTAYARTCARLIERSGQAGGPRSYLVARACTLAPDAVADASLPGRRAEKELRASDRQFWSLTERGRWPTGTAASRSRCSFSNRAFGRTPNRGRPYRTGCGWPWPISASGSPRRRAAGWTTPVRGSINTATGCLPAPRRSWGCTCIIGWKLTSCASKQKAWCSPELPEMARKTGNTSAHETECRLPPEGKRSNASGGAITGSCGWRFDLGGVPLVNRKTTSRPKWPRSTPPWISLQPCRSPGQRPGARTP